MTHGPRAASRDARAAALASALYVAAWLLPWTAPLRGAGGRVVGAISVASAAQYMDRARMDRLGDVVRDCASTISRELGYFNART